MFYNEWDEINEIPDEFFSTPPFAEVIADASSWILPSPYCAVVRSWNKKQGKLKEYVYRSATSAAKKVKQLEAEGLDITILTNEVIATVNYDPNA